MFIVNFCIVVVIVIGLVSNISADYIFSTTALSKYNHFAKNPLNDELIQTGGRLIERHIGYLYEAGYKSILSTVVFSTNDTVYNGVTGNFPATEYEMSIAESYGLTGKYYASSFTVDSANAVSKLIDEMPKPVYIHCHVGYSANLFTQVHLYLNHKVTAEEIYKNGLALGYDYQNNTDIVNLINSLSGRSDVTTPQKIEFPLADGESSYKYYYWAHRLGLSDYWYNSGQILSSHVDAIRSTGYKTVISFRSNGEATARLPNETSTPIPNAEFSDMNGNYDVTQEEAAISASNMNFLNLPLNSAATTTWTKEQFFEYLPYFQQAEAAGPVYVHCASGYRSSAYILTYLAYKEKKCSEWVFYEGKWVGFNFNSATPSSTDVQVVSFVKSVLGC